MNRITSCFAVLLLVFSVTVLGATASAADLSGRLVISGSDAMEELVNDLAKGFMKIHRNVKIIVRGGESGMGISETRSDAATIGMVSRTLTPEEALDLRSFTIAYEGICFVTSTKNPVTDISMAQLKEILLGRNSNWKNIGGNDLRITSLMPYRKSASNKIVAEFLGVQVADLKGTEINDYEAGIKAVSRDPKAIFYVSTGKAFYEKLNGMPFNILSVSGKKANMVSISQNRYPLTRSLNLITLGDPNPLAKAFISYCLSPSAAHTIRSHYFIKPQ